MSAYSWAILTACIWGFVPILEKIGLSHANPIAGVFYRCLGILVGFILMGFFIFKPEDIRAVDLRAILFLVAAGLLASFLAQLTFYQGLKLGEVSKIVPISASYPLITFILGILIFKENFTLVKGLGVLAVVFGIWAIKIG
jgi:transporter family protein